MANSLLTNPIFIDTFTSAIDLSKYYDSPMIVTTIEWAKPTNTSHTAYVQVGGSGGPKIFDEQCIVGNQSVFKHFPNGQRVKPLYIPATDGTIFGSGSLIITLDQ